jgi:peptidoglycan/xylan/chitin deacetylase (PgdA/CDA1 family)
MEVVMWNQNRKCAVALCFDFDAESLWVMKNLTTPSFMSRGEYGARVGVPRILPLLEKYDIKATFFVPADTARRHPDLVKEIHARGHEIGHHGDVHENPAKLSRPEEERVLRTGIDTLEKLTGERPRGYRSPAWDLSHNTIGLLRQHGFLYDSSLMGDDFRPYWVVDQGKQTEIVEMPVSWELDDAAHFFFTFSPVYYTGMAAPDKIYDIWATEFEGAYQNEGIFVLTMHPQLIGRYHRLKMVEKLIQTIAGYSHVWFTTCTEIATDWRNRETSQPAAR